MLGFKPRLPTVADLECNIWLVKNRPQVTLVHVSTCLGTD